MKLACSAASYFFLGINWGQEKLKCNLQGSLKNACECPEDVWREMNETGDAVLLHNVTTEVQTQCPVLLTPLKGHFTVKRSSEKGDNND